MGLTLGSLVIAKPLCILKQLLLFSIPIKQGKRFSETLGRNAETELTIDIPLQRKLSECTEMHGIDVKPRLY